MGSWPSPSGCWGQRLGLRHVRQQNGLQMGAVCFLGRQAPDFLDSLEIHGTKVTPPGKLVVWSPAVRSCSGNGFPLTPPPQEPRVLPPMQTTQFWGFNGYLFLGRLSSVGPVPTLLPFGHLEPCPTRCLAFGTQPGFQGSRGGGLPVRHSKVEFLDPSHLERTRQVADFFQKLRDVFQKFRDLPPNSREETRQKTPLLGNPVSTPHRRSQPRTRARGPSLESRNNPRPDFQEKAQLVGECR